MNGAVWFYMAWLKRNGLIETEGERVTLRALT